MARPLERCFVLSERDGRKLGSKTSYPSVLLVLVLVLESRTAEPTRDISKRTHSKEPSAPTATQAVAFSERPIGYEHRFAEHEHEHEGPVLVLRLKIAQTLLKHGELGLEFLGRLVQQFGIT